MNAAFSALLNGAILGSLLTAGVWLGLRLAGRRLNAATRHWIWWAQLAVVVLLPLLLAPLPRAARPSPAVIAAPAQVSVIEVTNPASHPPAPAALHLPLPLSLPAGRWIAWFAVLWCASSVFLLLRLLIGSILLARRAARAAAIPAVDWLPHCGRRGGRIKVGYSPEVAVPMAVGLFQPAILIPENMRSLPALELEQIGLHEAAHLARGDDYALLAQRVLEAIFVLHPAIRWIGRQIDLEREIACDDFVIAFTGDPRPYAACLARVAELSGPSPAAGMAVIERSQLIRRVKMLLDRTRNGKTGVLRFKLALALSGVALLALAAARSPQWVVLAAPAPQVSAPASLSPPPTPAPALVLAAHRPARRLLAQVQTPAAPPPPSDVRFERVHVTDQQGADVGDLSASDFRLFDAGTPQRLTDFNRETITAAVAVILDVRDGPGMSDWRQSLVQATSRFNPVMVTTLAASGDTDHDLDALRSAVSAASARLSAVPVERRVLIVISDAAQAGALQLDQPQHSVNSADAAIGRRVDLRLNSAQLTNTPLERFANMTDYRLTYTPSAAPQDGKFHNVRIGVDRPDVSVRAGRAFFLQNR